MSKVVTSTERWLESVIIELNLCPFAKREYRSHRVRFTESSAHTEEELLKDLVIELSVLQRRPEIETTLLITPSMLAEFEQYNQFFGFAESVVKEMHFEGIYQLASFHPEYQFAGTSPDDVSNYTNRSPYPIIHVLREASLERAIEQHPDTESIPQQNINLMEQLGEKKMQSLLANCKSESA